MKNCLFRILTLSVIASLLFSGCTAVTATKLSSSKSTSTTMPKAMKKVLEMSDQKLADKLGDLDLCLIDNLLFTNSKNISSETLFTFFEYIIDPYEKEYPENYIKRWYNKSEGRYDVPVSDIISILNKYFDGIKFDPTKFNGYNAKSKSIENTFDGFGGARFPKLFKKEILSNDTLRVTIVYYDDTYKKVQYTKIYTIMYTDDGYKYLSIVKV